MYSYNANCMWAGVVTCHWTGIFTFILLVMLLLESNQDSNILPVASSGSLRAYRTFLEWELRK